MLKATLKNVRAAAKIVKKGGLIVYPTDTVYGLGCDPFNVSAVEKLIHVKGTRDKPLPILAYSLNDINRVAEPSEKARRIGEKFWPGPLTLILPRKRPSNLVTFSLTTIGVRIPNHKVALKLIRLSGGLLIGTSANKTGAQPPSTAAEVYEQLNGKVDMILDGGMVELGVSSTILDLTCERLKVLRKGPVNLEDIMESFEKSV
ncbi:MAG: L-threonylcarbamoyladenylate synthase [Candidatus Bathyarchaeota archaeon]|nr:L-threonylcarbamoyladenylate synthase [Candidatus Bathyarchaeota archaeon]